MQLKGRVHKFGDNVNTDDIIAAKYLNTIDPKILGSHCMEHLVPNFAKRIKKGDIIVGGRNFGCGSSREHAPLAIKACGISCVIAESFARIFYRNAINIGLPIMENKTASESIENGDSVDITLDTGRIYDNTNKEDYTAQAFPEFMQKIVKAGGLMKHIKKKGKK